MGPYPEAPGTENAWDSMNQLSGSSDLRKTNSGLSLAIDFTKTNLSHLFTITLNDMWGPHAVVGTLDSTNL